MHEAIVQWRIVIVFKHQRIYGYRPLHPAYSPSSLPCCAVNSHPVSFLYSRGCNHPVPSRRVSVRNYTKCLRRAGYVVQAYHPAPLGAADPIKGCILCCRNVRYFLPPNDDADHLVKTLRNQTRASWFKPPHYGIVLIRDIFVVSKHRQLTPPGLSEVISKKKWGQVRVHSCGLRRYWGIRLMASNLT